MKAAAIATLLAFIGTTVGATANGAGLSEDARELEVALTQRFPQGTQSKAAQDHLESLGFVCKPGKGLYYVERTRSTQTGTYIHCDRSVSAGTIGKRWQLVLVTEADRVGAIHASYNVSSQKSGPHPASTDIGRPGQYRLLESNNDPACKSFAKIFAASRS